MNRKSLLAAVEFASKVITGKPSLPILECVHLKGDGERLTVTGYNLDMWCRAEFESSEVIDICVPARNLKTLLQNLDDGISLTVRGTMVQVSDGKRGKPLDGIAGEEFPVMPDAGGEIFVLPGDAIALVADAASTDATRYVLNGVYFDTAGYLTATSGAVMHSQEHTVPVAFILPNAAAAILKGETGEIRCDGRKFCATGDGWTLAGQVIEGNYPNWRQAFVRPTQKGVPVTPDFIQAIERCVKCMGDPGQVHSWCQVQDGKLAAPGDWTDSLELKAPAFRVRPDLLLGLLKAAGDAAELCIMSETDPIAVRNATGFLGVVPVQRLQ